MQDALLELHYFSSRKLNIWFSDDKDAFRSLYCNFLISVTVTLTM